MKKFIRDKRAAVAVEFALLAPIAIFILAITLETCRVELTSMLLERSLYDIAYQSKVAKGQGFPEIVASVLEQRHNGVFSPSEVQVVATYSRYPDEVYYGNAFAGAGLGGDVVKLNLRAELGIFNKIVPNPFKIVRNIDYYYINEKDLEDYQ
jgi:Flp pilus assembly pilin Flp